MKKIIAVIIALVVVFAVALCVESSFSKEKIDFVGEAENIEYYFEKMYLYNTGSMSIVGVKNPKK